MPELRPLRDDLAPEVRSLATFLREAFDEIETGVRSYAQSIHREPGAVSRFLSGDRIPHQDFIDKLLADAYPQHSPSAAEEVLRRGRDLRNDALRVCNSRVAEAERLAQDLDDARHEILLATLRERELSEALLNKQIKVDSLLEERRRMESAQGDSSSTGHQIESRQHQLYRIIKERERAQREANRLSQELAREVEIRKAVEKYRDQLRAALDVANSELVKSGAPAIEIDPHDRTGQLQAALHEYRTHLGGMSNLIAITSVICAGPVYLGFIYHTLLAPFGAAQLMTILGLAIPGWLALRMRNLWHFGSRGRLKDFAQIAVLIGCLFLIGFLV
jgi:DNA repair exonuclease SbcCD ATPase subunit